MDEELTGDLGDDDLDAALRRSLGRAAGPVGPANAAWEQLTPRLRRARRRHRAGIVGASLLVIGGISAVALATNPMEQRSQVIVPAGQSRESTSSTRVSDTTTSTATGASTTSTLPAPGVTSTRPGSDTGPVGAVVGEAPVPAVEETTTTTAPDETRTYVAPGGRATVRFAGGALTLVDFSANPGYTAEVHKAEAHDVEVRFHPASGAESRIRVRVENATVSSETE